MAMATRYKQNLASEKEIEIEVPSGRPEDLDSISYKARWSRVVTGVLLLLPGVERAAAVGMTTGRAVSTGIAKQGVK